MTQCDSRSLIHYYQTQGKFFFLFSMVQFYKSQTPDQIVFMYNHQSSKCLLMQVRLGKAFASE